MPPSWDHPRMRGEHFSQRVSMDDETGSSPHARGTLLPGQARGRPSGIIPACAGNTSADMSSSPFSRDHPRMRGEHGVIRCSILTSWGSSPHARGTPVRISVNQPVSGIIPACAGNTNGERFGPSVRRDHPRMRGEHIRRMVGRLLIGGSSPHARGTPSGSFRSCGCSRIIPACAGNTTR